MELIKIIPARGIYLSTNRTKAFLHESFLQKHQEILQIFTVDGNIQNKKSTLIPLQNWHHYYDNSCFPSVDKTDGDRTLEDVHPIQPAIGEFANTILNAIRIINECFHFHMHCVFFCVCRQATTSQCVQRVDSLLGILYVLLCVCKKLKMFAKNIVER